MHCLIAIEIMGPQSPGQNGHWQTCRAEAGPGFPFWLPGLLTLMMFTGTTEAEVCMAVKSLSPLMNITLIPRFRALAWLLFCRGVPFVVWWIIHQPSAPPSVFCLLCLHFLFYWRTHLTRFMCLSLALWSWNSRYGMDKSAFWFNF